MNKSETDWARIDAMSDEDIDFSDCPEATLEMFAKAVVRRVPSRQTSVNFNGDHTMLTTVDEIYDRLIKDLALTERLRLATLILNNLVGQYFPDSDLKSEVMMSDKLEDFCLGQAMDESLQTPLLGREDALRFLEEESGNEA